MFTEVRSMSRSRVKGCRSRALAFTTTTVHELTASVYLIAFSFSICRGAPPLSRPFNPVDHISGHDGVFSCHVSHRSSGLPFPPSPRHRCVYTPR